MKKYSPSAVFLIAAVSAVLLMGAGRTITGPTGTAGASSVSPGKAAGNAANGTVNSLHGSVTTSATTSIASYPTASITSRPTGTPVTLSPYAEELARIINFDRQVLIMVKEESHERIQRLVGYDEDGYQIIAPGIAVSVPEDKSEGILAALRRKLTPLNYRAFVVEMNAGLKVDKIGVLKGTDQYEILRIMHTDGDEYDITNQDVIDRLREWEKISSFDIIGADYDWVEIEFKRLPKDLKAFAEEVYDFSPDAVDEGPGTVEGLIGDLKRTSRLFLLWD